MDQPRAVAPERTGSACSFQSMAGTMHVHNISGDQRVSVAIYRPPGPRRQPRPSDPREGTAPRRHVARRRTAELQDHPGRGLVLRSPRLRQGPRTSRPVRATPRMERFAPGWLKSSAFRPWDRATAPIGVENSWSDTVAGHDVVASHAVLRVETPGQTSRSDTGDRPLTNRRTRTPAH